MNVLYCDDQILVVSKASGELAQPNGTGDVDVLSLGKSHLERAGSDDPFLGLVHRLDRPTSGIMVMARTSAVARDLSAQFREHTVEKTYVALVEGQLRGIGTWEDYVAKPGRQPKIVSPDHPEGKYAELTWQVLHQEGECTLLQVQLHSGRPHQIRLQASDRGVPIVGDTRYGASVPFSANAIALHHAVLRFDLPDRERRLTFVAPVPSTWTSVLSRAAGEAVEALLDRTKPGRPGPE